MEMANKDSEPSSSVSSIGMGKNMFFAIRTTAGQETNVALMIEVRAKTSNLPIYSILSLPNLKGYIVLETPGLHIVYEAIRGLKHVKGKTSGTLKWEDLEVLIKPRSLIELIQVGEEVEVVAGPFRGMKAKIIAIDKARNEVSLNVLEASYPLTITVPIDYIRPSRRER